MTSKYFLKDTNNLNPNDYAFRCSKSLSTCPDDIKEYIILLYSTAVQYEDIIREKNKIIEAKHKEIQRLNTCLLNKFFSIKTLKKLLDLRHNTKFPDDTNKRYLSQILDKDTKEKWLDEMVKMNQNAGLYD